MRTIPLFLGLLVGCGGSTETTPVTDAAPDTSTSSDVAVDSPTDAGGDATCDLGTIPALTPFTAEFLFVGGDGGVAVPTPTGGDPKGDWRFTKVTIYLSETARSLVDLSKSSVTGTGFGSYTATTFRNSTDQKITLETTVVGPVKRGTITKGKGTWKMEGNEIVYTPECSESTAGGAIPRVGWSRIDDDHARLQFKPAPTGMGDFTEQLVIDLERIK